MRETGPLPGGAGQPRAQPMPQADSSGHLTGAWLKMVTSLAQLFCGDRPQGPWGAALPPSLAAAVH